MIFEKLFLWPKNYINSIYASRPTNVDAAQNAVFYRHSPGKRGKGEERLRGFYKKQSHETAHVWRHVGSEASALLGATLQWILMLNSMPQGVRQGGGLCDYTIQQLTRRKGKCQASDANN